MSRIGVLRARFRYAWTARRVEIGPLLITTHEQDTRRGWNAFELGRDYGAVAGPSPQPKPERHLHAIS